MKKVIKLVDKKMTYAIKLPDGKKIIIGPGISNLPTSSESVKETNIKKMIEAAKAASKAGIFDKKTNEYESSFSST